MTAKQKAYRASLVKQVHTSRKWQAFYKEDREAYESRLFEAFGVKSSTKLSITQLEALVKFLNDLLPELPTIKERSQEATARQIAAIERLWELYANDTSEGALRNFVLKLTGTRYLRLSMMRRADATKVILALKTTLKKRG